MNNFIINVVCEGKEMFWKAVEIAFKQNRPERPQTATHFLIDPKLGFVFLWSDEGAAQPFPYPLHWEQAADMAWEWLQRMDAKTFNEYEAAPDFDGSTERGWRVYCDFWGHVGELRYAIAAVKPAWAWYGK